MEPFTVVVEAYRDFARYAAGESACFTAWGEGVQADPVVQRWIAGLPPIKQQPNLVFAAARWHGVPAPGPYAALRAALLGDDGAIRATILARATQTNEVGRLATLTPLLARIQREAGEPLALVEPGASAGLCLYPDRWGYRWATGAGTVDLAGAAGPLTCEVGGAGELPDRPVRVGWRAGVDLNPLDVADDDAMAWLANLVWPEQYERRARLVEAVEVARADPPYLVAGDLVERLPGLVEEAGRHGQPVVFHSAVIAYLEVRQRRRFADLMAGLVADGACRWLSNEGPKVLPGLAPDTMPAGPLFALALDGRPVAATHGHGRSMSWL